MDVQGMKNIVLTRVDDRLVHGQVMTSWSKATNANKFMVIDDEVAANDLMKTVLKGVIPGNIKLGIFTIAKAADRLTKGFKPDDRVIILVKTPITILKLQKMGISFKHLNIGGIGTRSDRETLWRNIAVTADEKQAIRELIAEGTEVFIQITADDSKVDVAKLIG